MAPKSTTTRVCLFLLFHAVLTVAFSRPSHFVEHIQNGKETYSASPQSCPRRTYDSLLPEHECLFQDHVTTMSANERVKAERVSEEEKSETTSPGKDEDTSRPASCQREHSNKPDDALERRARKLFETISSYSADEVIASGTLVIRDTVRKAKKSAQEVWNLVEPYQRKTFLIDLMPSGVTEEKQVEHGVRFEADKEAVEPTEQNPSESDALRSSSDTNTLQRDDQDAISLDETLQQMRDIISILSSAHNVLIDRKSEHLRFPKRLWLRVRYSYKGWALENLTRKKYKQEAWTLSNLRDTARDLATLLRTSNVKTNIALVSQTFAKEMVSSLSSLQETIQNGADQGWFSTPNSGLHVEELKSKLVPHTEELLHAVGEMAGKARRAGEHLGSQEQIAKFLKGVSTSLAALREENWSTRIEAFYQNSTIWVAGVLQALKETEPSDGGPSFNTVRRVKRALSGPLRSGWRCLVILCTGTFQFLYKSFHGIMFWVNLVQRFFSICSLVASTVIENAVYVILGIVAVALLYCLALLLRATVLYLAEMSDAISIIMGLEQIPRRGESSRTTALRRTYARSSESTSNNVLRRTYARSSESTSKSRAAIAHTHTYTRGEYSPQDSSVQPVSDTNPARGRSTHPTSRNTTGVGSQASVVMVPLGISERPARRSEVNQPSNFAHGGRRSNHSNGVHNEPPIILGVHEVQLNYEREATAVGTKENTSTSPVRGVRPARNNASNFQGQKSKAKRKKGRQEARNQTSDPTSDLSAEDAPTFATRRKPSVESLSPL